MAATDPTTMPPDPPIDEIREIRHQISAKFDHDPAKLVAYLMQYQEQFRDRLVYDPSLRPTAENVIGCDVKKTASSCSTPPAVESKE